MISPLELEVTEDTTLEEKVCSSEILYKTRPWVSGYFV